jgi:hypothetical protein
MISVHELEVLQWYHARYAINGKMYYIKLEVAPACATRVSMPVAGEKHGTILPSIGQKTF